ncbi:MAG: hypothetical protein AAF399_09910 [Bacteroidota bacterium]
MKHWISLVLILWMVPAFGQQAIGLRFASDIHFFPRAKDYALVDNAFTTGKFGVYYNNYKPNSGFEVGLNVNYKDGNGKGFPSLPVVMRDYGQDETQNVGMTALEMDLKVGPRFGYLYPRIGYILGYRFTQLGFQENGFEDPVNPWYLMLPFGLSVNLPTNYGSVGFGSFFNVGIFNVLRDPNPGDGNIYDGGRERFITFEITVSYETRR